MDIKIIKSADPIGSIEVGPTAEEMKFTNDIYGSIYISTCDDECIINALFVRKDARRMGFGAELLKEAECHVADLGYDHAVLYAVIGDWPHEWYKRMGYVDTEERLEGGYVKMVKKLNNKEEQKDE